MAKGRVNLWETHSSTVLSITLVMFLLGLCLLVEYHSYRSTHDLQERITFKVDLESDVSPEAAASIQQQLESMPMVKRVDYISREEAADIFSEDLGEDFVSFIGYNPLYPSMMVNLRVNYLPEIRQGDIDRFARQTQTIEGVTGVTYQEGLVRELEDDFYRTSWFLIIFIVLLVIISILMIRSTMSIALYAQRDTIRTMTLVGAKPAFIARPFLNRSLWYGFWGALAAIVVLALAAGVFFQVFGGVEFLSPEHLPWYGVIALLIIIVSLVLSFTSTLSAVSRYLRYNS